MTYQDIISLTAAGFTKADIYQLVNASAQLAPVAPAAPAAPAPVAPPAPAPVAPEAQNPQADMLSILQRLNAQQSGIDLPPARTSDDILSERLMSLFETRPTEQSK